MSRQKAAFYTNKYQRKNVIDFSIKMPAKRPEPPAKKLPQPQSSAHTSKRKPYQQQPKPSQEINRSKDVSRIKKQCKVENVLDEDQIRNSRIYKLLEEEMMELMKSEEAELKRLKQMRNQKKKEVDSLDTQTHAIKLQIWELRNEALQLKESIEEEKNQTERLMQEIGNAPQNNNEFEEEGELNDDDDDL